MNAKLSKGLVCELCDDCQRYCTIKEMMQIAAFIDPRTIIQIKCVEIYKFNRSSEEGFDIGWEQALLEWGASNPGYAKLFADIYTDLTEKSASIHPRKLYNAIIGRIEDGKES